MRYRRIEVSEGSIVSGLKPIAMEKLGQVVALFGKNGAGKSRILNMIENFSTSECQRSSQHARGGNTDYLLSELQQHKEGLETRKKTLKALKNKEMSEAVDRSQIKDLENQIRQNQVHINRLNTSYNLWTTFPEREKLWYVSPPRNGETVMRVGPSPDVIRSGETGYLAKMTNSLAFFGESISEPKFGESVVAFMHALAAAKMAEESEEVAKDVLPIWAGLFDQVKASLHEIAGLDLGYKYIGASNGVRASIGGRILHAVELSDGQLTLIDLVMRIALVRRGKEGWPNLPSYQDCLIVWDEPERHLHPAAVDAALSALRSAVGDRGQIWLATHSVAIMSCLKPGECWVVDAGEVISPSVEIYGKCLNELVGDRSAVERLRTVTSEPALWAGAQFTAQCLKEPEVVGHRVQDPQLQQIRSAISGRSGQGSIRVLDFGAGRARVASSVLRHVADASSRFEYIAIEKNIERHDGILQAASAFEKKAVYESIEKFVEADGGDCDCVILCNTLHEVLVTDWEDLLQKLLNVLSAEGRLLICEDLQMSVGELPHVLGYLILDVEQIEELFSCKGKCTSIRSECQEYEERLLCVCVPKELASVTGKSVKDSVESLHTCSKDAVRQLRENAIDMGARDGRLYSYYCQALINSMLAVEELEKIDAGVA